MKKFLSLMLAAVMSASAFATVIVSADAPAAPSAIEVPAAAVTYSSIALIWDKPDDYADVTGYNVYINGELAATTDADETFYTAEDLSADTEYTFSVTSLEGTSESAESVSLTASTQALGTVRNVLDYGAKGDGTTVDTDAIQAAIDACEENDIVLLPESYTFISGALDLKSNMTLEVNGTLQSSTDPTDFEKDYDPDGTYTSGETVASVYTAEAQKRLIWSRIEGWEQYCYRSLINVGYLDEDTDYDADGDSCVDSYVCENVKICGTGTITGDSSISNYSPISGNATALAKAEGASADEFYDIDASETTENNIRSRIRGRLINVSNSQNVYIKGVTVANPPCWTVHMIYSDNISTNGVTFNTSGIRNGDGWDPDSSSNCTIFDCTFSTGDDCVAIKSGKNPEGNEVGIPARNIKVIGCESNGGLGLAVGSEMSGGVDGVEVRDCTLANTRYGVEIKANAVRGGYVKNFSVSDSTIDQILIHSVTYNADGDAADTPPVFSDMSFKNLTVTGYYNYTSSWLDTAIELVGFTDSDNGSDSYYVQNISFDNIVVGTEGKNETQTISLTRCKGISFADVVQVDGNSPTYSATNAEYTATINGVDVDDIVPTFTDTIEAEKMNLSGYVTESNTYASGGYDIKLNASAVGTVGTAKAEYSGESGTKDIAVYYFDENDGVDTYTLYVNDTQIDTWTADTDRGSDGADALTRTNHITSSVALEAGDVITIEAAITKQYGRARVDLLEVGDVGTIEAIGDPDENIPEFTDEIEAEDMFLNGYAVESNSAASGGECVSANSTGSGTASAKYMGTGGECTLTVYYFDENDGNAAWMVYVNDEVADTWTANEDLGSASADSATLTSRDIAVTLSEGDIIKIQGVKETYDPARLDRIVVTAPEPVIPDGTTVTYEAGTVAITSSDAYDNAAVIFAAYASDGTMTAVYTATVDIVVGTTDVAADETFVSAADGAETVKVFVWLSAAEMMPITAV